MNGRQRFLDIINRRSDHCGFWHGNPNPASINYLYSAFQVKDDFELGIRLGDCCRWIPPHEHGAWKHPEGKKLFDALDGAPRISLGQPGIFAECEDVREIERHAWPDVRYLDFTETIAEINRTAEAGQAVLSGMWSNFFHMTYDYFGIENYFIKLYTDPAVVEAVTEHVVEFFLQANEILFRECGDKIDTYFFGNDFGSQLDLLISPEHFDRFIMPAFRKFTDQAHRHGLKVLLHSCGSIDRVIPRLIDAGVDALHPIQAKAANMDAASLARKYNGDIVFIGGVDTQELLPFGTPAQVRDEVYRLRELFGPNFVVSPSHESILPGVSAENILAMAEAAAE